MKKSFLTLTLICMPTVLLAMDGAKILVNHINYSALSAFHECKIQAFQDIAKESDGENTGEHFDLNYQFPTLGNRTLLTLLCGDKPADMSSTDYELCLHHLLNQPKLEVYERFKGGLTCPALNAAIFNKCSNALRVLMEYKSKSNHTLSRTNWAQSLVPGAAAYNHRDHVKILLADPLVDPNLPAHDRPILRTLQTGLIAFPDPLSDHLTQLTIMRDLAEHGARVDLNKVEKSLIARILACMYFADAYNRTDEKNFIDYTRILSLLALGAPITLDEMNVFLPEVMPVHHTFIISRTKKSNPSVTFFAAAIETAVNGGILASSKRLVGSNFEVLLGENIDMQDTSFKMTPLMWAAARGNRELAMELIAHKADLKRADRWGYTALHFAVLNGHTAMVELLLQQSSTLRLAKSVDGKTPTDLAISSKKSVEMLRILSKKR